MNHLRLYSVSGIENNIVVIVIFIVVIVILFSFLWLFAEGVVFLAEEGDDDREAGDEHLAGRGIPTHRFDTQLQTKIVDQQIKQHNQRVTSQLAIAA